MNIVQVQIMLTHIHFYLEVTLNTEVLNKWSYFIS